MLANEKLARAISDVGFGEIRRQLEYKTLRYKTDLIVADRWYLAVVYVLGVIGKRETHLTRSSMDMHRVWYDS